MPQFEWYRGHVIYARLKVFFFEMGVFHYFRKER